VLPRKQKVPTHVEIRRSESSYSSPIPPPELLNHYNEIIPDGANRILKMAEEQSQHRQSLERYVLKHDSIRAYVGQASALIIGLSGLGIGGFLVYSGHDVAGATVAGSTLVSLVTAFLTGTKSKRDERDKRNEKNLKLR
jgi:uncharacterized membrane protein